MLPIAVLPVAGLLLRLGQPDLLNIAVRGRGRRRDLPQSRPAVRHRRRGRASRKDGNGAAGLAGVVCFLVASNGAQALMAVPPDALAGLTGKAARPGRGRVQGRRDLPSSSVPLGILSGLIAGGLLQPLRRDQAAGLSGLLRRPALRADRQRRWRAWRWRRSFGLGWSTPQPAASTALSQPSSRAGPLGLFAYGVLNRLLIVTGLHHILNNVAWFILGDYHGATGDLNRFFAGDPTAGAFMTGFFPVMMFGLPAACLAMYHTRPAGAARGGGRHAGCRWR